MNDLINEDFTFTIELKENSRQELLKLLEEWDKLDDIFDGKPFEIRQGKRSVVLKAEKKASWSQVSGQATLCSCCGRASNAKQARNWSYCPYCGTKMEEIK